LALGEPLGNGEVVGEAVLLPDGGGEADVGEVGENGKKEGKGESLGPFHGLVFTGCGDRVGFVKAF